ncbi:uncharacterized protein LOC128356299 [Scomber scombrus]|uniref:non-specific serine/threonine protein kinase n=1 Tax=Scomber scombrus TaxID=13677 RepID=A0AAV1NX79_SCOSC
MGSRRTMINSSFGNGRSSNGVDINGSSRPGGCSYLSNVRPENRSTLCSVMAQLKEETQPSFETTLKSKAVSEKSNVKFSCVVKGYPAPQVIWYKDDMQLDRYCGLPKYEIFRNGQNHSLHIYNCTVEDAAIYQASASNNKGIVSCSGVLEVGEMNEFKIHQRYFAKLKQKAENKRKEVEGKENQEPLRTISPDRSQRKRRSTMEAFLSIPSSMEDEGNEESQQTVALESETTAVEEVEERPVPVTNGTVSAITNGQVINENGTKGGTYTYDSAQNIFTLHQPKTPFVKKKIKISNSSKVAKADTQGERASDERREKEEPPTSLALTCTESGHSKGNLVEDMEVENIVSSSVLDSDSRNVAQHNLKSSMEEALFVSKDENVCAVPSQKEQLTASVSLAAYTSTKNIASGTEGKLAAKHKKENEHKDTEEHLEMQNQNPHMMSTQLQTSAVPAPQQAQIIKHITITDDVTVMDVHSKSNTSTDGTLLNRDFESVDTSCERRIALPQRPCEQTGDQLSEKETTPCQKNVSVPQQVLLSEVTQAHTKMNRNDAPVNLELPPNQCSMEARLPQKTPSERETTTDDIQTPSVHHGLQAAIDKMTQDTWDHSRGSNVSHTALFTDLPKSPFESPGGGESTRGCNVSPTDQQSQVDTPIKSEGTEIQVDEKLEGNDVGKLSVQAESVVPDENIVEMETENNDEMDKNEPILKMEEKTSSDLHNVKPAKFETAMPHLKKPPENTNLCEHQIKGFKEIPKTVTRVISVAELLRSQLEALDVTVANSMPTLLVPAEYEQNHTITATDTCQELRGDESSCKLEVKTSIPDRKIETSIDNPPLKNIKETLMEIYHQLNLTDQEQTQTQGRISPPVQDSQKPLVIPPISVIDTGTTGQHGSAKQYNETVMDIGQEIKASLLVSPKDCLVVSISESENVRNSVTPMASKEELTQRLTSSSNLSGKVHQEPGTPLTMTPMKARCEEHTTDEPVQGKDMGSLQKLTPKDQANSKSQRKKTEINSTTFSDQCKIEEHNTNSCLQSVSKTSTKSVLGTDTQENNHQPIEQESPMVEEFSRTDSLTNPNPGASPLLKRRNCVSPIPSATPQELASGARRKILIPKVKPEEATTLIDNQTQKKEASIQSSKLSSSPSLLSSSPSISRRSPLLQPPGERTSPVEKQSPLLSRRKMTTETKSPNHQPTEEIPIPKTEIKPVEKDKHDPFKAPQVIRKIRGETFADASGHLKLWCQFFNILSDSTITWYRNEVKIVQMKRNAGDETQVNLAIAQASSKDSGVYGCTITNEYGTDSTDYLLSADILAGMSLREELGVGEEIEMTPLVFNKGVADSGVWGNKFFGRIMMQESRIGDGCAHKVWRAKVIYGLEPVFESGNTCIVKVCNPIAYGGKEESCLIDRNLDFVRKECKIQNLAREYCKIFSAEARVIENFGPSLEVIPVYMMYRPANTIPYATVEADLMGVYQKYSLLDHTGRIEMKTASEVEQKCCALQHWIFQWTNGNLLLTQLEGVDTKITNVGITVKSTGHQGLSVEGNPKVFEQFISQHQCNYFCGLLSLRSLKDSLMTPTKPKGSRSPLLQRKMTAGSSSPQTGRKAASSPRLPRKAEQSSKTATKQSC